MEGMILTITLIVAIAIGVGLVPRWRGRRRYPKQTSDPPGERSAPDDWPRDGGDNPPAP